jgi:hypothetical protein
VLQAVPLLSGAVIARRPRSKPFRRDVPGGRDDVEERVFLLAVESVRA